jgi:hypothetical protein
MPFEIRYYFVASMDVTPEKVDLFNEMYDTEHVPSLMTVPDVISVSRSQKTVHRDFLGFSIDDLYSVHS